MPKISVIVPVYGVELYIESCLRSIAAQTFSDFELILVDDGSQDRSIGLAEAYLRSTALTWRIIRQENAGQGIARDHGVREAKGEYVVCVDSDDTVSPVFLEELYTASQTYHADVAFCLFQMVPEARSLQFTQQKSVYQSISRPEMLRRFLCRTLIPLLPSMLIRRSLLMEHAIHAPAGCRFSEDVYVMWHIFAAAEQISYTTAPLYNYLMRPTSTMAASSAGRILTGYTAFRALLDQTDFLACFSERKWILPRWVLGALNSTARISDYSDFMAVAEQMDYRRCMKALEPFPEWKARILSPLLRISPKLYYRLLHRRK